MTVGSSETESWPLKSSSTRVSCPSGILFGRSLLTPDQKTPPTAMCQLLQNDITQLADPIASRATDGVQCQCLRSWESCTSGDVSRQQRRQSRPLPLCPTLVDDTHVVLMHDMASGSLSSDRQTRRSVHKLSGRAPKSSADSMEDSSRESSVTSSVSTPARRPSRKQPASEPVVSPTRGNEPVTAFSPADYRCEEEKE